MKSFTELAWAAYRWSLDAFLPPQCVLCGKVETWLCATCAPQLAHFTGPFCVRCGRPWEAETVCPVCLESPLHVAPIRAAYLFEGPIREVLHALKYRGGKSVTRVLAPAMAQVWHAQGFQSDVLAPVPLHPARQMKRGYNQAELLARCLGRELGLPVLTHTLSRVRNTPSQTRLDRSARRANVQEAFIYTGDAALVGKCVTLVDDVATTGATLEACATVLLAQGVAAVNAFTLARAP